MKTYRESMESLRFTQEEKVRMTDRLMEAAAAEKPRRRSLRRLTAVGAAAALVLAVGVGAGASGIFKTAGEAFSAVFGGAPAQTEIIDRIGRPIGASATSNGVTITADAILGDTYSYAIVYSISRDDGAPLAEDMEELNMDGRLLLSFEEFGADIGSRGGAHGQAYFFDADPADNAVQYVEMMTQDEPIRQGTARTTFRDLSRYDGEFNRIPVAEGTWKLKFDFAFENAARNLKAGQSFRLSGMDAVLDEVLISPFSYQVNYTVDSEIQWDEERADGRQSGHDREESERYFGSLILKLNLKDGTTMDLSNSGGSIRPEKGKTYCQKSGVFEEILALEDIESITVGDMVLPLEP